MKCQGEIVFEPE